MVTLPPRSASLGVTPQTMADNMIDEVARLEASLQEVFVGMNRNHLHGSPMHGSPRATVDPRAAEAAGSYGGSLLPYQLSSSTSAGVYEYTNAVDTYGAQLRNWVETHAEAKVRQLLSCEVLQIRQEFASLKNAQVKLLSVVESISQELSRAKQSISGTEQAQQALNSARCGDFDALKNELKWWTERQQEDFAADLLKRQHRLISDLRDETTAAFRSEAAALASLDEHVVLAEKRLAARIDRVVDTTRSTGSLPLSSREERNIWIRRTPPVFGAASEAEGDPAVCSERSDTFGGPGLLQKIDSYAQREGETWPARCVTLRYGKRVESDASGSPNRDGTVGPL